MSSRAMFLSLNNQLPPDGSGRLDPGGTYFADPTIYPPPEREPIDDINYIPLPAIGASASVITRLVEPGFNGIIRAYANNFVGGGWTEGSGSVTWAILLDNAAVPGYDLIPASLGSPANPVYHPSGFRIMEAQTLILQVTNVSVVLAGQLIGGRFLGYYYPKEYDDPSRGGNP